MGLLGRALYIAERYLPEAQVQQINTDRTIGMPGGFITFDMAFIAATYRNNSRAYVEQHYPTVLDRYIYLVDSRNKPDIDHERIATALGRLPHALYERLCGTDQTYRHQVVPYVAGLMSVRDTVGGVAPPHASEDRQIADIERIISIGDYREEPIYAARMACRQAGVVMPGMVPATGQLFVGSQ